LYSDVNEQASNLNSKFAHNFVEALFINPFFSSKTLRSNINIRNSKTFFDLLRKFLRAGIITDITPDKKRNKLYRFDALANILKR